MNKNPVSLTADKESAKEMFSKTLDQSMEETSSSAKEIADVLGVTSWTIRSWKRKEYLPEFKNLIQLLNFFVGKELRESLLENLCYYGIRESKVGQELMSNKTYISRYAKEMEKVKEYKTKIDRYESELTEIKSKIENLLKGD